MNLELKFEKNVNPPKKVSYELFYVLPKLKSGSEIRDKKTIEFVSKFYCGDANKKKYRLEDFEVVYNSVYRDDHHKQLKGEFRNNQLRLLTSEMDNTPFLMKVTA